MGELSLALMLGVEVVNKTFEERIKLGGVLLLMDNFTAIFINLGL